MRGVTAGTAILALLLTPAIGVPASAAPAALPAASPASSLQTTTCPAVSAVVHRAAPGSGKTVALTFDDGPGPTTPQILSILMRYGVRATFFNNGGHLVSYPVTTRSEVALDQTLGNHTWNHPVLSTRTAAQQAAEMDRTTAAQVAVTGTAPCLFRPPYGDYNATTLALASARHMAVWTWNVDPEDWKASGTLSGYWVHRIVTRAEAGGTMTHPVILLHNTTAGSPSTAAALPTIIEFYRARGYAFVDLMGHGGLAPYRPNGAPGPAVAATAGGLRLFTRGPTGAVLERTRTGAGWGPAVSRGGSADGAPAVATLRSDAVMVAIVGTDHHVRVRTLADTAAGAWTDLGGSGRGRPAVAVDRETGTVTVAVRTATGAIGFRRRVGGVWATWQTLGGAMVTAPAVAVSGHGTLSVVAADAAGVLWQRDRAPAWTGWRRIGTGSTADPALLATPDRSHLVLLVRTGSGALHVRLGTPAGWGTWRSIGGLVSSGAGATGYGSRIEVFVGGTDGITYRAVATSGATASGWTGWSAQPF